MNILCYWLGHIGNSTESGFHVCDRCGLHEYWDGDESYRSTDYLKARKLFVVLDWVKLWRIRLKRRIDHLLWQIRHWNDDMPF